MLSMKRTFIEAKDFQKTLESMGDPNLLRSIQETLLKEPLLGDLIRGAGGIRKFRMGAQGKGKSGGIRIFYLDVPSKEKCYLLFLLKKSESENITDEEKSELRTLAQLLKK
jgi:hypothetical protein